ncbi:Tn3 family transposase [Rhizohabitans arisaemae]|uniref:Tn3 family transposase n=1 Tax=Rhizohabitans arisaemae TaxID=2720610 RepID=UPI0024B1B90C|nr:Tn3 family transposase [Rhizohabitans arisaemae]
MIRYATAIRTRTASTEAILRRFTRNASHPTYAAMLEVSRGGSVAVNHGWSRGAHVRKDGLWTVDELADQPKDLPMDDPFNKLSDALGGPSVTPGTPSSNR